MLHARVGMLRALNRHVERVSTATEKTRIGGGGSWHGIGGGAQHESPRTAAPRSTIDLASRLRLDVLPIASE
jgi:hypothetical protein